MMLRLYKELSRLIIDEKYHNINENDIVLKNLLNLYKDYSMEYDNKLNVHYLNFIDKNSILDTSEFWKAVYKM